MYRVSGEQLPYQTRQVCWHNQLLSSAFSCCSAPLRFRVQGLRQCQDVTLKFCCPTWLQDCRGMQSCYQVCKSSCPRPQPVVNGEVCKTYGIMSGNSAAQKACGMTKVSESLPSPVPASCWLQCQLQQQQEWPKRTLPIAESHASSTCRSHLIHWHCHWQLLSHPICCCCCCLPACRPTAQVAWGQPPASRYP